MLGIAFILRVVYVLQMQANPYFASPRMDPLYHVQWAQAFARGETFQEGPFFRAPLYPWFLGILFRIFGDGLLLPRLVQCGLGTVTVAFVYLIGRQLFDVRTALLGSLFAATYWVLIYFDGELLLETLSTPLAMAGLWATLGIAGGKPRRFALVAGLLLGLSAITRPNVLAFCPFLVGWIAWLHRPNWRASLAPLVLFSIGCAAPILPITVHNRVVGGDAVLISSQAGVNLWIGNNPLSDGSTAVVPGTRADWWGGYHDTIALAEQAEGRALAPSEVSSYYSRKAWSFLITDSERSIPLLLWKLRLFWMDRELGNNQEVRFFAERFSSVVPLLPLRFFLLAPLGLLGLATLLSSSARGKSFPLWGFTLVYMATVVLFFVNARFRVPVLPPLALLAANGALWLADRAGERRWRALLPALLMATLAGWWIRSVPASVNPPETAGYLLLGQAEMDRDQPALAARLFRASIASWPGNSMAHRELGRALAATGDSAAAESSYAAALDLLPEDATTHDLLAELHLGQGRLDTALRDAERSLQLAPTNARGAFNRAQALWQMSRPLEASQAFLQAERFGRGTDFESYAANGAGLALWRSGDPEQAVLSFERAIQTGFASNAAHLDESYRSLVELLHELGREAEARAWSQRAASRR